jgi:hypothetical protein
MSSSCLKATVTAAVALALVATQAHGASWQYDPRIHVGVLHDDNYRLTEVRGAEVEATGGWVDAQLSLRSEEPRGYLELTPRLRTTIFPDASEEESTDGFFGGRWNRRWLRVESNVDLHYSDESVISSELVTAEFPDIDLGDVVIGDDGRAQVRNRRQLASLQPRVAFDWTQRSRVEGALSYIEADFDRTFEEQSGFRDISASAGYAFDVTPRDTVSIRGRIGEYEPDSAFDATLRTGVHGEWTRRWTETSQVYIRIGTDSTETDVRRRETPLSPLLPVTVTQSSWVGGVGTKWQRQVTEVVLDVVRSSSPSSAGVVTIRDEARASVRRALSARFWLEGFVRAVRTDGAIEDLTNVRDREYLASKVGFQWRASRQTTVLGAYHYDWQEFEGGLTDATSNQINFSVIYEPRRRD